MKCKVLLVFFFVFLLVGGACESGLISVDSKGSREATGIAPPASTPSSVPALALRNSVCDYQYSTAQAFSHFYVAQTPIGKANGSDCANALPYSFFNNASNWGSRADQIAPGTTVHICGTVIAQAGASSLFSFQAGGAPGKPITLTFEQGAMLSAPYWGERGAIYGYGISHIIVDGGQDGLIKATANGTALPYQKDGKGVYLVNCSNCEVRNLTVADLYLHQGTTDNGGQGVYGIHAYGGNNILIHKNTVHDAKWCINYGFPGNAQSSNPGIFLNHSYRCDHGIAVGSGNVGASVSNVNICGNTIEDAVNWDNDNNINHHDGIHIWAVHSGSSFSGLQIYNNRVRGDWGKHCTANIFVEANGGGTAHPYFIYNNDLGATNASQNVCGNGFISVQGNSIAVLNNTFISDSNVGGVMGINLAGTGLVFQNNLTVSLGMGVHSPSNSTIAQSDYNIFYNLSRNAMVSKGIFYSLLSAWSTSTGFDRHSFALNPNLTADHQLPQGSPLMGAGLNLSDLNIAPLKANILGQPRPSSGGWNPGAY